MNTIKINGKKYSDIKGKISIQGGKVYADGQEQYSQESEQDNKEKPMQIGFIGLVIILFIGPKIMDFINMAWVLSLILTTLVMTAILILGIFFYIRTTPPDDPQ